MEVSEISAKIEKYVVHTKSLWIAYISVTASVAVILSLIHDADLILSNGTAKLPFLDLEVPSRSFLWLSPMLVTVSYCLFVHAAKQLRTAIYNVPLHLMKESHAAIRPFLIADFFYFSSQVDDNAENHGSMLVVTSFIATLAFGPLVVVYSWGRSMQLHDINLTSWLAILICCTLWFLGGTVADVLAGRAQSIDQPSPSDESSIALHGWVSGSLPALIYILPALMYFGLFGVSAWSTGYLHRLGLPLKPISANMEGLKLSQLNDGWRTYTQDRRRFLGKTCEDAETYGCAYLAERLRSVSNQDEWRFIRDNALKNVERPNMGEQDLSFANFRGGVLIGANFRKSYMRKADFSWAKMERSNFAIGDLIEANFEFADLQSVTFSFSKMHAAWFFRADLSDAKMDSVSGNFVDFSMANLSRTEILGSDFGFSDFRFSLFDSSIIRAFAGRETNFRGSDFSGAGFIATDLTSVVNTGNLDLANTFGDASVKLPDGFEVPCQWGKVVLSSDEYFGRWRGWVEANPQPFANHWKGRILEGAGSNWHLSSPRWYRNVEPIPPPSDCAWVEIDTIYSRQEMPVIESIEFQLR